MERHIHTALHEEFSRRELIDFVALISRYHRIQGSRELETALDYIRGLLEECKNLTVSMYSFSYSESYGIHYPIAGWDVKYAEVRLVKPAAKLLHSFYDSKTVAVAHSPPGVVEAPVVYVGEGTRDSDYLNKRISGRIVLAYGNPYIVYMIGVQHGASGFIFFRRTGPEHAVPYLGLFLRPDEATKATAPAVAISRKNAVEIINKLEKGEEVVARIVVESEYRAEAQIRVVEAKLGDGDGEVHVFAHICHPGGTVNDNVSGSATILELARAFDRAITKRKLDTPKYYAISFVWFPEYYGSLPYLLSKTRQSRIVFGINLDMIGERQEITGSTLNFIRAPSILRSEYEALLLHVLLDELAQSHTPSALRKTLAFRVDVLPYERGSDHDIYLQFGIPSVMLNQWPDRYYHTDLDTLDKFDPEIATRIAIAVGTTTYLIATNAVNKSILSSLRKYYEEYVKGYEAIRTPLDTVHKRYCREAKGSNETRYRYIGEPGAISIRMLFHKLPKHAFYELLNMLDREKHLWGIITGYIPIVLRHKTMSLSELSQTILEEYGIEIEIQVLEKLLNYLIDVGLIERV